eukprot:75486-Pleurochrysis_carterae.AAC.1
MERVHSRVQSASAESCVETRRLLASVREQGREGGRGVETLEAKLQVKLFGNGEGGGEEGGGAMQRLSLIHI